MIEIKKTGIITTSLAVAFLVLILGIGLIAVANFTAKSSEVLSVKLDDAIPRQFGDWTSKDLPLGPTENATEASKEILGFDDYINRDYSYGAVHVNLYVAYWRPGTLTARMVRGHVPDNCWVSAGWEMTMPSSSARVVALSGIEFERRLFRHRDETLEVIYAQVVDGKTHQFSLKQAKDRFDDAMHYWDWRTAGKKSQFFLRISSQNSIESLKGTPLMGAIEDFIRQYVLEGANET